MRYALMGLLLVSACMFCGCGTSSTSSSEAGPRAKHGGNIMALPDGKGLVELLIERLPTEKAAPGTLPKGGKSRLLAYFYQSDGAAALTPPPTDVTIHLGSADKGQDVKLTPQEQTEGQFASEAGQYPDELRGQLALNLGGQSLEAPFMFR